MNQVVRILHLVCEVCVLAFGSSCLAQTPWITLANASSGDRITLVGTAHASLMVDEATAKQLHDLLARADTVYFESVDGLYSDRRLPIYRRAPTKFAREEQLTGRAKVCAIGVKLTFAKNAHEVIDAAPVILRAFMMERLLGVRGQAAGDPTQVNLADRNLLEWSLKRGIKVAEAETTDDIVDFAAQFTLAEVESTLTAMCLASQKSETKLRAQTLAGTAPAALASGDWDRYWDYYRVFERDVMQMPDRVFNALMRGRNERMISRALARKGRNNVALVVGGAHVGGPGGLLELLRERGFETVQ